MDDRKRLGCAIAATVASAAACIVTVIEPHWFELIFNSAPDNGDGSVETMVAILVSTFASLFFAVFTGRVWRRMRLISENAAFLGS